MDIARFQAGYSDCNTDYAWAGWQAALAQPAQEPVADGLIRDYINALLANKPDLAAKSTKRMVDYVYTTPPQRTWVGIPEADLKQGDESFFVAWREGARWADAYLKEKNNG
jgi:hypothetical protein